MNLFTLSKYVFEDTRRCFREFRSLDTHIQAAMDWLCLAQDSQPDGGVSLRYSLFKGWETSYPETTGYIIPTFLNYAHLTQKDIYFQRAIKMADWELSIQERDGSFKGGPLGSGYGSFVFDTGQIIFGLIEAHRATKAEKYIEGAVKAGKWLVNVQDSEGMWKNFTFNSIPHVYYSRVAWALAALGTYLKDDVYSKAACRNIDWVLTKQHDNGWFDEAGFTEMAHATPYTHTIAYTIEGVMETGICLNRQDYMASAVKAAVSLIQACRQGFFYGTYDCHWTSNVRYSCLTGNAQIANILLRLYLNHHSEKEFFRVAQEINRSLCYCQDLNGPFYSKGAISGSYPIWGKYERFAFPNWATKFFVDALLMEKEILLNENGIQVGTTKLTFNL